MSREASSDYMAAKILRQTSRGYELSFGTSLAMVGQLGADKNCVRQINSQTDTT